MQTFDAGVLSGLPGDDDAAAAPRAPASDPARDPAARDECSDVLSRSIYLVASPAEGFASHRSIRLMRFEPATEQFETIGPIVCPGHKEGYFFSFAVDRGGNGYALPIEWGGQLFRVDTQTAACQALGSVFGERKVAAFYGGMTFVGDSSEGEALYASTNDQTHDYRAPNRLERIDVGGLWFSEVADLPDEYHTQPPALAGTGKGNLFGLYLDSANILRIHPRTGRRRKKWRMANLARPAAAFAFFGGDFYLFEPYGSSSPDPRDEMVHGSGPPGGPSIPAVPVDRKRCPDAGTSLDCSGTAVLRYRPRKSSMVEITRLEGYDVRAATTSTCVPQR